MYVIKMTVQPLIVYKNRAFNLIVVSLVANSNIASFLTKFWG